MELFFFIAYDSLTIILLVPIALDIQKAYRLDSALAVNLCAIIFQITNIPMTFVSIKMFKLYSVSNILRFATVIMLLGSWFRIYTMVNGKFWPVLVGYFIQSFCSAFFV